MVDQERLDIIGRIGVRIQVRVGSTKILIGDMLKWGQGTVIELDKDNRAPVDIFAEGHHIGTGEVVQVGDNYGVRIVELFRRTKEKEEDEP
jgi:flagellar motor switch protein FliN/FliY